MGVASTKVLKGVMEAENQEENSPEKLPLQEPEEERPGRL